MRPVSSKSYDNLKAIAFIFILSSCHFKVDVTERYQLYFDDETYDVYQKGLKAYEDGSYLLADSLLSAVISKSENKLSIDMPKEFNPYYYRGHNNIELGKYEHAIKDFDLVASDTTTETDILLVRSEAFRMLGKYDTAILLCNRLLDLKYDSAIVLRQRGICFYQKKDLKSACADLIRAKELGNDNSGFLDKLLKDCK